jgi:hypothetical protein
MGVVNSATPVTSQETREVHEETNKKILEFQVTAQSQLFDKAATYNNIVVSLGYAGFISIWTWAQETLHPWDAMFSALLIGVSLFFFVLWNVVTTFIVSINNMKLSKILSKAHSSPTLKLLELDEQSREIEKRVLKYYATWYVIFLITAITGFVSGAILIILIGLKILGSNFGVHSLFGLYS